MYEAKDEAFKNAKAIENVKDCTDDEYWEDESCYPSDEQGVVEFMFIHYKVLHGTSST